MVLNVALVYPNFKWDEWIKRTVWDLHPYNICLLAAMIEKYYNVIIIDANIDDLSKEEFSEKIKSFNPDIVGISVCTNEYNKSGIISAELIKKINPNIKIIFGGVSAISDPEEIIKNYNIDYVCIGEGEYLIKEFCDFINGNGKFPEKGIWYKENSEIKKTPRNNFIFNLDDLPLPAYHLIDFMKYANRQQRESVDHPRAMPYARIITSRGCPFNCCFCEVETISGKIPRLRSVENIMKEIDFLVEKYGIKSIIFDDDNLTINRERAKNFFMELKKRKYKLKWNAPATALFTLDDELLDLMKESGCEFLGVAIESGNERVLRDIVQKPLNLNLVKEIIKKIKERDIDLVANFVLGFPGETWEEIRETLRFAENIDIDYARIFIATPLPNTKLFKIAKEKNCIREGFSFNKHLWTDGWIDTPEFRHQDLKILRAYEWDRINFSSEKKRKKIAQMMDVSEERLNEIRKETLRRVNP